MIGLLVGLFGGRGEYTYTLFEIHSCIYRRDFAYPVRNTSPIYIGKHGYKQCTPTPTGLPIYTGGILRTPTQNLSYIYRKDFVYSLIARNDGFWRSPETDFRNETEARKVMVVLKFDALFRKVVIMRLLMSS